MAELAKSLDACWKCGYKQRPGIALCKRCGALMSAKPPELPPKSAELEAATGLGLMFLVGLVVIVCALAGLWYFMYVFAGSKVANDIIIQVPTVPGG